MPRHIAIIGGGIGGLATAWYLRRRATTAGIDLRITLCEAAERPGGVIASSEEDGFILEHGPDSIIRIKPAGMQLIDELDLNDQIQGTNPDLAGSLIAKGDRLLPIPDGLYLMAPGRMIPFALSPLLSWRGKLRTAMDLFLPRRPADAPEESLAAFVRRRLGQEALDRIAQPLVGGIYTADPEYLSLAHCMPQFIDMERNHRSLILGMRHRAKAAKKQRGGEGKVSGARYGLFISLKGGLQALIDRLVDRLDGIDLRCDWPVAGIERAGASWQVKGPEGDTLAADDVVIAAQANTAARLLEPVDQDLGEALASIPYASVATVNIAFDRKDIGDLPEAAGFVVPAIENRNLIACTFSSTKYLERCPADGVLLRAFCGGAMHESQLDVDDATLVERILADLRRWLPLPGAPRFTRVHRWAHAMAQPTVGHIDRLAAVRTRESAVGHLALVGNGYEGVGIPDIIHQAQQAAERLLADTSEDADHGDRAA